jgi:hypothetical protein
MIWIKKCSNFKFLCFDHALCKTVAELRQNHPWTTKAVKTRHAATIVIKTMAGRLQDLKEEGQSMNDYKFST